ncbi:MAG: hypothetical protein J6T35_07880 [Bacteroidales bacterium]|nr:hypothetical protein [Bacteroidales bacterium]
MKKRILLLALFLVGAIGVSAQTAAQVSKLIDANYNRNSLSLIYLLKGDSYDDSIENMALRQTVGEKFDANTIAVKTLRAEVGRDKIASDEEVAALLAKKQVGKRIVAFVFNRRKSGMMDDELLKSRGVYNAKAQDIADAGSTQVGMYAIQASGGKLLRQSYVTVFDYAVEYVPAKHTKDEKQDEAWKVHSVAYAFKVDISDDVLADFYEKCWIYSDDSDEVKAAKKAAWDNYTFALKRVAGAVHTTTVNAQNKVASAMSSSYSNLMESLEKSIADWQVKATICDVNPLRSKIGTKEGIRNGDRYQVWGYVADEQGRISSKKTGYVRATKIANNAGKTAAQKADPSEFYQVGGYGRVEDGQVLQQSRDARLSVYPYYKYSLSHMTDFNVGLDYLLSINTAGMCQYLFLNFGFDFGSLGVFNKPDYASPYALDGKPITDFFFVNVSFGYGFGLHVSRYVEFTPYVAVGMDNVSSSQLEKFFKDDEAKKKKLFTDSTGWFGDVGLKVNILPYPFQVFGIVDYSFLFLKGSVYNEVNNSMGARQHKSGVNFGGGIRYCF